MNIRGIRFQLRYAVMRGAELAVRSRLAPAAAASDAETLHPSASLQFEGIEDVDVREGPLLRPLGLSGDVAEELELIQLKTAANGWGWHKLGEPLVGFLEAIRTRAPGIRLRLVTNFPFRGDLDLLARYEQIPEHSRRSVRTKFVQLCEKVGGTEEEADQLLQCMRLESITEDVLRDRTRNALAEISGAADSAALDGYEALLAGRSLTWAAERARVTGADILGVLRNFGEGMARQEHFTAVAHRWVGPVDFAVDEHPDDFFAGKRVRIGHVVAGLDVARPAWLMRVEQALVGTGVCVIRAPSGHGKSTLAYRYVVQNWGHRDTIVVRSAETPEQVAAIADYLRFRADLGLPVRVLIDAESQTRLWPQIANEAMAVGAQVLITVRTEDWHRYALDALARREIIEPTLDLEEARQIFAAFRARGQTHPSVASAAWAFERLRAPHLLLEYVYLITHGVMLAERLRDQVRGFRRLGEDPKKAQVLGLVSLANALGAPVVLNRLLAIVPLDDPQEVIGSLVGEYTVLEEGRLVALHWVRSEHVARLLHEGGIPPVTGTALTVLDLIPDASLPFVVANAMAWDGIDRPAFLAGLVERFRDAETATLLPVLEGLFESGERDYFAANRALVEQAHDLIGSSGLLLVSVATAPLLKVDLAQTMIELFPAPQALFADLQGIYAQATNGPRGIDRVREILAALTPFRGENHLRVASGDLGLFLDWCALTSAQIPAWPAVREGLISQRPLMVTSDSGLPLFAQGLFRYDRAAYDAWFETHRTELLACLQLQTDCLSLRLVEPSSVLLRELGPAERDDESSFDEDPIEQPPSAKDRAQAEEDARKHGPPALDVNISFFVTPDGADRPLDQTMRRLEVLRSALPLAGRYIAHGEYMLPAGLVVPVDDTRKHIPRWNMPFRSDIRKNTVWGRILETEFYADTLFRIQESWYEVRTLALRVMRGIAGMIKALLQNRRVDVQRLFGPGEDPVFLLERQAIRLPRTGGESFERLFGTLPEPLQSDVIRRAPDKWIIAVQNFRRHFWEYSNGREDRIGRLLEANMREAVERLAEMHQFFASLFLESPDYFGARELDAEEREVYRDLRLLLDGFATHPLGYFTDRPLEDLRRREAERENDQIGRIGRALEHIPGIVLPTGFVERNWTRSTALGIPVGDPLQPQPELIAALDALAPTADVADWLWLIPIQGGARLAHGGYQMATRLLNEETLSEEERSFVVMALMIPSEVPDEVLALLPDLRVIPTPTASLALQATGVLAGTAMLVQRRILVDRILDDGEHPCLVELHAQQRAATGAIDADLRQALDRLRDGVEAHVVSASRHTAGRWPEMEQFLTDIDAVVSDWSANPEVLDAWDEARVIAAADAGQMEEP